MKEHDNGKAEWDATFKEKDADGEGTSASNREFHPHSSDEARTYLKELVGFGADVDGKDPLAFRLMLALSIDGETWKKTGMVIVNHASVPCLAVEKNEMGEETLYLFFVTSRDAITETYIYNDDDSVESTCVYNDDGVCIEKNRTTPLAVAYTTDLLTWTSRFLDCEAAGFIYPDLDAYGLDADEYSANDPSVARATGVTPDEADDGSIQWMMYYTLHYDDGDSTAAVILVAFAEHLYDFSWTTGNGGAPVLPPSDADPGSKAEDPSAAPVEMDIDSGYLLFAGGNKSGYNWIAALSDGVNVDESDQIQKTCFGVTIATDADGSVLRDADGAAVLKPVDPIIMCNAVDAPGTSLHLTWIAAAGDDNLARYIVSIPYSTSAYSYLDFTEGTDKAGSGCNVILVQDPDLAYEHNGIREAAVARFNGCWVMVYVTGIAIP